MQLAGNCYLTAHLQHTLSGCQLWPRQRSTGLLPRMGLKRPHNEIGCKQSLKEPSLLQEALSLDHLTLNDLGISPTRPEPYQGVAWQLGMRQQV